MQERDPLISIRVIVHKNALLRVSSLEPYHTIASRAVSCASLDPLMFDRCIASLRKVMSDTHGTEVHRDNLG
jgi:hypothetical protein